MRRESMEFEALPEGCIANILSHTTPVDACRLSLVSKTFCSAADSDVVWDHFLPSDFMSIISRSDSKSSLLAHSPSKKSLYLALSHHPIIIDDATKSFQLDRKSGKKCYMLAARALTIAWGDNPEHWKWKTLLKSRFREVVELFHVCWFEIRGAINTNALSPNTHYEAYLVVKMIDANGFHRRHVELSVDIVGGQSSTKNVCLEDRQLHNRLQGLQRHRLVRSNLSCWMTVVETKGDIVGGQSSTRKVCLDPNLENRKIHNSLQGLQLRNVRSDGWLEIKIGEFFNSGLEDDEVQMSVLETNRIKWKSGLFIEGIEVRPREGN